MRIVQGLLLALGLALSGNALAGAPVWDGVPIHQLESLGFEDAKPSQSWDGWSAVLKAGGFADVWIYPTTEEAIQAFTFQGQTASIPTAAQAVSVTGADAASGDSGYLTIRSRNIVATIRSNDGTADKVAARLIRAMVEDAPEAPISKPYGSKVLRWDSVGRRLR